VRKFTQSNKRNKLAVKKHNRQAEKTVDAEVVDAEFEEVKSDKK
jgi:hypothetical protein